MLGPPKPRRLDEPIAVSLEDLVPQDHFYRHLVARLDLAFVREWARELYAERGRPSIDPVIFFKLQLVMFFEEIHSGRKLMQPFRDERALTAARTPETQLKILRSRDRRPSEPLKPSSGFYRRGFLHFLSFPLRVACATPH